MRGQRRQVIVPPIETRSKWSRMLPSVLEAAVCFIKRSDTGSVRVTVHANGWWFHTNYAKPTFAELELLGLSKKHHRHVANEYTVLKVPSLKQRTGLLTSSEASEVKAHLSEKFKSQFAATYENGTLLVRAVTEKLKYYDPNKQGELTECPESVKWALVSVASQVTEARVMAGRFAEHYDSSLGLAAALVWPLVDVSVEGFRSLLKHSMSGNNFAVCPDVDIRLRWDVFCQFLEAIKTGRTRQEQNAIMLRQWVDSTRPTDSDLTDCVEIALERALEAEIYPRRRL